MIRDIQNSEVLAVIERAKGRPAPKPTKADRPKKKGHVHGICPQCGEIFHSKEAVHADGCTREIPVIMVRKNQTDRQLIESALDALCRLITIWRDGCNCVLEHSDGAKCGGISQWGHVVPQGSCTYLIYNLSNAFRQCESHNGIHRFVQLPYHLWYQAKFGKLALNMLEAARKDNPSCKFSIPELREKLSFLNMLYDNRHSYSTATMEEKVDAGYYGPIIWEAWIKEGRIPVSHSIPERTAV